MKIQKIIRIVNVILSIVLLVHIIGMKVCGGIDSGTVIGNDDSSESIVSELPPSNMANPEKDENVTASSEVSWGDDWSIQQSFEPVEKFLFSTVWRYHTESQDYLFKLYDIKTDEQNERDKYYAMLYIYDKEGNTVLERRVTWKNDPQHEQIVLNIKDSNELRFNYDLKSYRLLYNDYPLVYIGNNDTSEFGETKQEKYRNVNINEAKQFLASFYERFLNIRDDGSFTLDIWEQGFNYPTKGRKTIDNMRTDFLSYFTDDFKNWLGSDNIDFDSGVIEVALAGIYNRGSDFLKSKSIKRLIPLGNEGKYNYRVVLDYKDNPENKETHYVLFRLVKVDGIIMIDTAKVDDINMYE